MRWTRALPLAVVVIAGFGGLGTPVRAAAAPGFLHVEHPAGARPLIADAQGRTVLLRGVNMPGLVDYWSGAVNNPPPYPVDTAAYIGSCPANNRAVEVPPLCEVQAGAGRYAQSTADGAMNDLAQARALGFNVIRLAVSWSLLEPRPGVYSTAYVDRIAQVVSWAAEQGLMVILDMHQDAWSRFIAGNGTAVDPLLSSPRGYDGAPQWATFTDGVPAAAVHGVRELDPAVQAAFTHFWMNRDAGVTGAAPGSGLQDHFIGAVALLAHRFKQSSTVTGYELFNEPSPGFIPEPGFSAGYLYPFYRRVIDAITGVQDGAVCPVASPYPAMCGYRDLGIHDTRHLMVVEPDTTRDVTDVSTQVSTPFSSFANLVFAPHTYTHVFTADAALGLPPQVLSSDQALQTADVEARAMNAALLVTEYGDSPAQDRTYLASLLAQQEKWRTGAMLWVWKENANDVNAASSWGMYDGPSTPTAQNGPLRDARMHLVCRVWPVATVGTLRASAYDPAAQSFVMSAAAPAGAHGDTEIAIPRFVTGDVHVSGAAQLVTVQSNPDGTRLGRVHPTGGDYSVTVSTQPPLNLAEAPVVPLFFLMPLIAAAGLMPKRRHTLM
jgi:endoglycosylceramidase